MSQAKTLSDAELYVLLSSVSGSRYELRDRLMLQLTYLAGLRVGEVAALIVGDVANGDGSPKSEIRLRPGQTKGRKARTVMVSNKLSVEIGKFLTGRSLDLQAPLFVSQKTQYRFTSVGLANHFKWIYDRAGIDNGSSHSGRRTFITNLAHKGVSVRVIQDLVGHSSMSTTQRYIDVSDNSKRMAVELI
ncbi:tyrosine-type recombinase/integrase [Phenylobacterium sp.]|uniref:tyrosine-type recombinase/integrase n=1 Tax=Phenylobacterium sp. TaxID=1871053 RepID=UPI0035B1B656